MFSHEIINANLVTVKVIWCHKKSYRVLYYIKLTSYIQCVCVNFAADWKANVFHHIFIYSSATYGNMSTTDYKDVKYKILGKFIHFHQKCDKALNTDTHTDTDTHTYTTHTHTHIYIYTYHYVVLQKQVHLTLSLTTRLYRPSLWGGLTGDILHRHKSAVYSF